MGNRGFTIIEVLVIIGLLVVLALFVYPMVVPTSHHHGTARIQSCGNNLRQIGQAFEAYILQKGKGRYPLRQSHSVNDEPLQGMTEGSKLVSGLFYGKRPVLEQSGNFWCPSDDIANPIEYERQTNEPFTFDVGTSSYLFRPDSYAALAGRGGGASPMFADRQSNHEGANIYMLDKSVSFYDLDRLFNEFPYEFEGDYYDSPMIDKSGNPILVP